jgi:hypothetical protein
MTASATFGSNNGLAVTFSNGGAVNYTDPNPGVSRDAKFGNLGIATASVYVQGSSNTSVNIPNGGITWAGGTLGLGGIVTANNLFKSGSGNATDWLVQSTNTNVGFGYDQTNGRATGYQGGTVKGYMNASGSWVSASTRTIKKNISLHSLATQFIDLIQPIKYQPTTDDIRSDVGNYYFGVIAEQLAEHPTMFDMFLSYDVDGHLSGVDYPRLALASALSVNAKLNDTVADLSNRIIALEAALRKRP